VSVDRTRAVPTESELAGLVDDARQGDLGATETLFRGLYGHLVPFLLLLGVRDDDIDDVAQDTVLRMYRSLTTYDPAHPVLPWVRGIARNAAAEHARLRAREARRRDVFGTYVREMAGEPSTLAALGAAWQPSLRACISRLADRHRELVQLRYFDELDCERIGRTVGMKPLAVRQALFRIRQALRKCMRSLGPGGPTGSTA
jgi:RNA polymerase sigma-70 factor (ECF subfamily)